MTKLASCGVKETCEGALIKGAYTRVPNMEQDGRRTRMQQRRE